MFFDGGVHGVEALGLLKFEIHQHRKTLSVIATTARAAVKACIDALLEEFREHDRELREYLGLELDWDH